MRLDATDLRYLTNDHFRVLTAVEIGSKNHEVVPTPLIAEISAIRGGNVRKSLGELAKRGLVARVQNTKYDGYRLTYGGLDYLSLRTFSRRKPATVAAVGKKLGVGKESDIYLVKGEGGEERVLKLQRLGRISFRSIKSKRDYLGKRQSASWMFMSRLAAEKEWAFMKVLHEHGFPVPLPIDHSRHGVVMALIDGYPLRQVEEVPSPAELYSTLMSLLLRLAHHGLIHGDYNEFNILIKRKTGEAVVIDFPQMVSTRHENAEFFFDRDVNCIRKFFRKRFKFEAQTWPTWKDVLAGPDVEEAADGAVEELPRLDEEVEASGFGRGQMQQLEEYLNEVQDLPPSDGEDEDEDGDEDEEEEEEDVEHRGQEDGQGKAEQEEELDEEAFQKKMSDRLEKLRLNRALGNDDPADQDQLDYGSDSASGLSDSEEEETSSEEEEEGDGQTVAASEYPDSVPRRVRPGRVSARKLGEKDKVQELVKGEMARRTAGAGGGGGGKKGMGLGRAKGHKWKTGEKYLVGKSSGW